MSACPVGSEYRNEYNSRKNDRPFCNTENQALNENFFGDSNIFEGIYLSKNKVHFLGTDWDVVGYEFDDNEKVDVVIRPEDWDVVPVEKAKIIGHVNSSIFKGVHYELKVEIENKEYKVHTYEDVKPGDNVGLKVDPYEICLMKVDGTCKKIVPIE